MCRFSPDQCCFYSSKCAGSRITWEVIKDFFITFNYVFAGEGHMYVIVGRYGAGCWEWNSGLLQEQYVLLTTERLLEMQSWVSALRSQNPRFNKEIVTVWRCCQVAKQRDTEFSGALPGFQGGVQLLGEGANLRSSPGPKLMAGSGVCQTAGSAPQ